MPITFEEIQTFDQPWPEILDIHEFNSILTDNSGVATLDGNLEDKSTPADDSSRTGAITSKLIACTMCKKRYGTDYLALVYKILSHNGCHYSVLTMKQYSKTLQVQTRFITPCRKSRNNLKQKQKGERRVVIISSIIFYGIYFLHLFFF